MPNYPVVDVVEIPLATQLTDGLMSADDKVRLDQGVGGGGLPEGTTLDEIPDGVSRLAISPADRDRLANYVANDGKTGDAHAVVTGNPHNLSADVLGVPDDAEFAGLVSVVDAQGIASGVLDDRITAAELEISDLVAETGVLDTRLDNLEAGSAAQWVFGPVTNGNAQSFANMPASVTAWPGTLTREVSLWKTSRLFFWAKIPAADTNTDAALRHQYTTDLTGATGWTDFPGADIDLNTTSATGRISSVINTPSGVTGQEFVLIRSCGVNGGGDQTPQITFPQIVMEMTALGAPGGGGGGGVDSWNSRTGTVNPQTGDYTFDQISETATGKKYTATEQTKLAGIASGAQVNTVSSVFGRTGAVVQVSGDYTTAQVPDSSDRRYVTDSEKARLANVPSDTTSAINAKADAAATTAAIATKADDVATTAALASKAPVVSPTFTGTPAAPTPATADNSTKIATTAFVKGQGYLTAIPAHTHPQSDVTGLVAAIADLQAQISALSGGGAITQQEISITSTAATPIPDKDLIYIRHTTNAFVTIGAELSKKPHTLVFLGNPNTVNVSGGVGAGQSVLGASGSGITYASGTDAAPVSRILSPDPDSVNFPNRWRIF